METVLRVSSTIIHKDEDGLAVWLHFDEDTTRLSDEAKSRRRRLINEAIRAIWEAQVPRPDEKYLLQNPRPDPRARTFVEEGDELSRIFWLAWESEKATGA